MRWVAFIEIEGFFAAVERRARGGGRPIIVLKDGLVLDRSADAAGAPVGATRRHALQNCPDAEFVLYDPESYHEAAYTFYDHCLSFTPGIEPVHENQVFLELVGGEEQRALARALADSLVPHFGHAVRLGMAANKLLARIAAIWDGASAAAGAVTCRTVAPGREAAFLSAVPVELLWPASPKVRERLARLGLRTCGDLARVPERDLLRQFGGSGRDLLAWAHGHYSQAVRRRYPPSAEECRRAFAGGLVDRAQLDSALAAVAAELQQRVAAKGCGAQRLTLTLTLIDGSELKSVRALPRPESTADVFATVLIGSAREFPIAAPVSELVVTASDLRPLIGRQLSLPDLCDVRRRLADEALDRTLTALAHRYRRAVVRPGSAFAPSRRERLLALFDPYRFADGGGGYDSHH